MTIALRSETHAFNEAAFFISRISDTYEFLKGETDLSPRNEAINQTLRQYVQTLMAEPDAKTLTEIFQSEKIRQIRPHLLQLLAHSESSMEHYWAEKFSAAEQCHKDDLDAFWYIENYRKLVQADLACIAETTGSDKFPADRTPLFIGSGPLPLSAILLHYETGCAVHCIDCDEDAVAASRAFIAKLGLSDKITVETRKGAEYGDYARHDLIFVAALVQDKVETLRHIHEKAGDAYLAVRSVEGLRRFLYEPLNIPEIRAQGFDVKGFAKASTTTVNSTYLFRRTPQ